MQDLIIEKCTFGPDVVRRTKEGYNFQFWDRCVGFSYRGKRYEFRLGTKIKEMAKRIGWRTSVWYEEDDQAMTEEFECIMDEFIK